VRRVQKLSGAAGLLAVALVGAACGSDNTSSSSATTASSATSGSSATTASSASSASSSGAASAIPAGPIKFGQIISQSGNYALYAKSSLAISKAALAQLNADGGIAGHQVEIDIQDDKSSPDGAVAAAQKLASEKVAAVTGIGVSPQPLQAAPVLNKAQIPVVALLTDETFEDGQKWPYIFNDYLDSNVGAAPYGAFVKKLGKTDVVMISDTTPASTNFGKSVKASLQAAGIKVVQEASFDPSAVDLTTEIQQLKAAGTDTLIAANVLGFGSLYNALRAVSWKPTVIETTAAYYDNSASLGDLAATTFAGCNVGLQAGKPFPDKVNAVLKAVTTDLGGPQPDAIVSVLSAYDALLQLKWAIEKVGSLDGTKIAKQLETINNMSFAGPDWPYTYTAQSHLGWPADNNHFCTVTPLDQYGTPTIAAQSL
jgi:branched-chain amino acid transport system substrate-binding protein